MKMIYLIFIVACLTEQLKADEFTVELTIISKGNNSLATVTEDPDFSVTLLSDINQGDITVEAELMDFGFNTFDNYVLEDFCNMDTSTDEGTLAAILWGSLGIDSCPIKAGDYPAVAKFNQTGVLESTFKYVREKITVTFRPKSKNNDQYFSLYAGVRLVKGEQSLLKSD